MECGYMDQRQHRAAAAVAVHKGNAMAMLVGYSRTAQMMRMGGEVGQATEGLQQ